MAAKIYSGIDGIEPPKFDFSNYNHKDYTEKYEKYVDQLKEECKKISNDPDVGEIISFPVADGKAQYMLLSVKPLQFIHLHNVDGYHEEMVELLTVKKTRELVQKARAIKEMFSKKS